MRISINNPCHENWDKMTPNEQGAFCLACQKNVVDFSKKTITEIKEFFTAVPDTEKVCGRFEETQLDELTFDDFFQRFRSWGFVKKAALIIYVIFGLSLFSCKPAEEIHTMGEALAIADVRTNSVENGNETQTLKGDVAVADTPSVHAIPVEPIQQVMGAVAYVPNTSKPNCNKDSTQHKPVIKGKVKVNNQKPEKQTPKEPMHLKGDVMREDDRK